MSKRKLSIDIEVESNDDPLLESTIQELIVDVTRTIKRVMNDETPDYSDEDEERTMSYKHDMWTSTPGR